MCPQNGNGRSRRGYRPESKKPHHSIIISKQSGLTRKALYKALRPNAHPRFDTISRACAASILRWAS
ncbi:MAG: DNA-binding protein [Acidithiobacillus sp.]